MIRFSCHNCGKKIEVSEKHAGRKGKCPFCGCVLTVPSLRQPDIAALAQQAPDTRLFSARSLLAPSLLLLLASNIAAIVWAIRENWSLATILWVYWAQGIAIGIFHIFTLLSLKDFDAPGFSCNGKPIKCDAAGKAFLVIGSFFIYGLPQAGLFLILRYFFRSNDYLSILTMSAIFLLQQTVSFFFQLSRLLHTKTDMSKLFGMPFVHVVPMYVSIVTGVLFFAALNSTVVLVAFLLIKTLTDVFMDLVDKIPSFTNLVDYLTPKQIKNHLSQPPRKVSALVHVVLMFSGKLANIGWILSGFALALLLLSSREPELRLLFIFIPVAPCVLVLALHRGLRKARLLKRGDLGLAEVINVEKASHKSSTSVIDYRFLAEDNSIHNLTIKTQYPKLLVDDDYEVLLYDRGKPSSAVLLDSLPAKLYIDKAGHIRIGDPVAAALALFSPKIMLFTCGVAVNIIPIMVR
jgi:hypothetical protein